MKKKSKDSVLSAPVVFEKPSKTKTKGKDQDTPDVAEDKHLSTAEKWLREQELAREERLLRQSLEEIGIDPDDLSNEPKPYFGPEDLRPTHAFIKSIPDTNSGDLRRQYKAFENIAGELALHRFSNLVQARRQLIGEFPYAVNIIDSVLGGQAKRYSVGKTSTLIEPVVIVGPPGLGKSRIARRICEVLGVHYRCISVAGMSDANIFGIARGWGSAAPSILTEVVQEAGYTNPVIILDEIEKVADQKRNGNVHEKLLSLLEKSEAARFHEPFFSLPVDASQIGWMFTANSLDGIPGPLRSRVRVLEMAVPGVEHLSAIIAGMRAEIAHEEGLDVRWVRGLDGAEMNAIVSSYKDHKSVRILRAQVQQLIGDRKMVVQ